MVIDYIRLKTDDVSLYEGDLRKLYRELSKGGLGTLSHKFYECLSNQNNIVIAARTPGGIIGVGSLHVVVGMQKTIGFIEDVVVLEEFHGLGIGATILNRLIYFANTMHVHELHLTSRPERERANKLYQSLGFEKRETNVYRFVF